MLKEEPRNTASPKLVGFHAWIIGVARLISEMVSRTSPSKSVCDFPDVVWCFFYNLLKFDIVNADIPFYKRAHNFETEVKLNKAQHSFLSEVSLSILAKFQLILLQDTC